MIQTDAIIFHLEERLRGLQRDSPVSKLKAFDPSCWPKWGTSDASAQFKESGQKDLRALTRHFSVLLSREGVNTEDVMSNFNDYKVFAQGRTAVPMRDTFLKKSGGCTTVRI